jgi:hypothetical protein
MVNFRTASTPHGNVVTLSRMRLFCLSAVLLVACGSGFETGGGSGQETGDSSGPLAEASAGSSSTDASSSTDGSISLGPLDASPDATDSSSGTGSPADASVDGCAPVILEPPATCEDNLGPAAMLGSVWVMGLEQPLGYTHNVLACWTAANITGAAECEHCTSQYTCKCLGPKLSASDATCACVDGANGPYCAN